MGALQLRDLRRGLPAPLHEPPPALPARAAAGVQRQPGRHAEDGPEVQRQRELAVALAPKSETIPVEEPCREALLANFGMYWKGISEWRLHNRHCDLFFS